MIVKVKTEKGSWSYFEGDHIIQHKHDTSFQSNTLYFVIYNDQKPNEGIYIKIRNKGQLVETIVSNLPTYLMNDSGKTIEKLF